MERTTQLSSGEYYAIEIYGENYASQFCQVLHYLHTWGELRNSVLVSTTLFTYMGRTMQVSSDEYYTIYIYGENYIQVC